MTLSGLMEVGQNVLIIALIAWLFWHVIRTARRLRKIEDRMGK